MSHGPAWRQHLQKSMALLMFQLRFCYDGCPPSIFPNSCCYWSGGLMFVMGTTPQTKQYLQLVWDMFIYYPLLKTALDPKHRSIETSVPETPQLSACQSLMFSGGKACCACWDGAGSAWDRWIAHGGCWNVGKEGHQPTWGGVVS